jgi:uncharacterized protein (DUF58 family)
MPVTSTTFERGLRGLGREQLKHIDRPAWRRFFLALLGLVLSFFLALYATALHDAGRYELAAAVATLSLLLAGVVGAKAVPYLARRTALERWISGIEYEFTRQGGIYLAFVVIITVAALNTGNNLLFMIVACLLAAILVSGLMSQLVLSGLELEVDLPEHVFAEQPAVLGLTLRNLKWVFPSFSISVADHASKSRRTQGTERAGVRAEPDKPTTYRILARPLFIPYLRRRSLVRTQVDVALPHRGRYAQDGFRIGTRFPFGLLGKLRPLPLYREIVVLPSIQPTDEFYEILPLISGEVESLHRGRGHDLYAIRDYRYTDTARHVDWKATAKVQQLKVREFAREDERRVILVFDAQLPAINDYQTLARFERGVTFCACLAWHFCEIDAQMRFVSETLETPMASASEIIYRVLENLALVQPSFGPDPATPLPPGGGVFARLSSAPSSFNIVLTFRPRGSIPTSLWSSSYVVFGDSL